MSANVSGGQRYRGSPVRLSTPTLVLVLAAIPVLLIGGGTMVTHVAPVSQKAQGAAPFSAALSENSVCPTIQSNTSLDRTYAYAYAQINGNQSNQTPPSNSSGAAPAGSYPNVTIGEQQLVAAWTSICDSQEYQSIYNEIYSKGGSGGVTSNLQPNGSTGILQAIYGFIFLASCNSPANFSTSGCEYLTNWYVNLTNGSVAGPFTTSGGTPLGGPGGPNTGGAQSSLSSTWLSPSHLAALLALAVAVAALALFLASRRPPAKKAAAGIDPDDRAESEVERSQASPDAPESTADPADPLSDVY